MKSLVLVLAVMLGASASADQFKTVYSKQNTKAYTYDIGYPEFFDNSVPGYAKINEGVKKMIDDNACDVSEQGSDEPSYDYYARVTVIALNKTYVGVEMQADSYCGGAHPNNWTSFMTFNSQTGEAVAIDREFGFQDFNDPNYDFEKAEALRAKIANILVDRIPKGTDAAECYGKTRQEKLENLNTFYPFVGGLAKNKQVVLAIDPPHVAAVCYFDARVDYNVIKDLLIPGSFLNTWLK